MEILRIGDDQDRKGTRVGAVSNVAKAVDECWKGGVRPILGGSCAETDRSARIMAHVALATSPAWVLARPGMGVDEGLQITYNEDPGYHQELGPQLIPRTGANSV